MYPKSNKNPVFLTLHGAFLLGTILMMVSGLYDQEWWAGLGLVLFMTSLLMTITYVYAPPSESSSSQQKNDQTNLTKAA